jgi:hypothetical protein
MGVGSQNLIPVDRNVGLPVDTSVANLRWLTVMKNGPARSGAPREQRNGGNNDQRVTKSFHLIIQDRPDRISN